MKQTPFTLEVTRQSARFTLFAPVAGAEYLQPAQSFAIPLESFRAICAQPPQPGEVSFLNFSAAQLKAHGVQPGKP